MLTTNNCYTTGKTCIGKLSEFIGILTAKLTIVYPLCIIYLSSVSLSSIHNLSIIYHHLSFICQLSSIYHLSIIYFSSMYHLCIISLSSMYIIYLSSFNYRLSLIYLSSNCHLTTIIYHLSVNKSINLYI